jgi:hypothetical protein
MLQQAAEHTGREHPDDAHLRASGDSGAGSYSRVGSVLGWLQELLLLLSLAVVCTSSFDIANGRAADQLDDITGMLRISAIGICVAIIIGLYLSIFHRPLRPSARFLHPPPAPPPPAAQPALHDSPSDGTCSSAGDKPHWHRKSSLQRTATCSAGHGISDEFSSGDSSPRDAPSSYSPAFVAQLRGQLVNVQHQLYAS